MTRLELALSVAKEAHAGQVDKAGVDYIDHPTAVAEKVAAEDEKIVALLHDTLEDTDLTYDSIRDLFGETVADAVRTMTHRDDEDYFDYIRRVKQNPISRAVKIADLDHNMDLSRLPRITDKDLKRVEKYRKALAILND